MNTDTATQLVENAADELTDDAKAAIEDAKDKFVRVPNRQMKRDMGHLRGEVQPLRSRIRRRVYRVRRYYDAKR